MAEAEDINFRSLTSVQPLRNLTIVQPQFPDEERRKDVYRLAVDVVADRREEEKADDGPAESGGARRSQETGFRAPGSRE